jgi:hypothetical protein
MESGKGKSTGDKITGGTCGEGGEEEALGPGGERGLDVASRERLWHAISGDECLRDLVRT